ncbi:glycosyltransferase family 2 protein, partial [Auriscalpium vulgare]
HNERKNLPIIVWLLARVFDEHALAWELIVVDDNSPDSTQEVARELAHAYGEDKIVRPSLAAHLAAKQTMKMLGPHIPMGSTSGSGDFGIIMDADFSHHPKFISQFIRYVPRPPFPASPHPCAQLRHFVTGTRYRETLQPAMTGTTPRGVYGWDLRRKFVSRGAHFLQFLADTVLNPGFTDLTVSFRLCKKSVLLQHIITLTQSRGYVFKMEMMVRARALGYSVGEVPITFVDRLFGESKLGADEIVQYGKGVWSLFTGV